MVELQFTSTTKNTHHNDNWILVYMSYALNSLKGVRGLHRF